VQRLAKEMLSASQHLRMAEKGSEDEASAVEELNSWLQAGELVVRLSRTVVQHCPTSDVYLTTVLGVATADPKLVCEEVMQITKAISAGLGLVRERAASLSRAIEELRNELISKPAGQAPVALPAAELLSPQRSAKCESAGTAEAPDPPEKGAFEEAVALLDAAAELEASTEWTSVAELDNAEPPQADDSKMDWEFDAAVLRKKRQIFLEKSESDRKAKRLKQLEEKQLQEKQMQAQKNEDRSAAPAPATTTAPADTQKPQEPARPKETALVKQEPAPVVKEEPKEKAAAAPGKGPAEALQVFLKDHPEFMRVLQNPKKCLADPRVKSMFVAELENYPAVKSFLAAKGLTG